MNRVQFADSLILDLGYDDVSKKLDRRQIYADIDKYLPLILTTWGKANGDAVLNNFVVTSVEPVKYDASRGKYCVDIPSPMNLGGFGGVRQIGDTQDESFSYVPIQSSFNSIASVLEVGGLADRIGFFLVGNRAYFQKDPIPVPPNIRVTRVPTIMNLTDTDEITCPSEALSYLCEKLTAVLMVQKQTPEDTVNDSKDNQ